MFIRKVKIHNFKCYRDFEITLEEGLNIVVGDNEAGKSTILVDCKLISQTNVVFAKVIHFIFPMVNYWNFIHLIEVFVDTVNKFLF